MSLERFTIIGTSNFNGLNRFRNGENMRPVLAQRQDFGFNCLRDWTAFRIPLIGDCEPTAALYAAIPDYLALCAEYGHYVELTAFTGPYPYFPNDASMIVHWERLDAAIDEAFRQGIVNLLDFEAVNEWNNAPNLGVPLELLRRPAGKLASHGSSIQDAPPYEPVWDVAGHRPGSNEFWRKVGHNPMADIADVYNVPAFCNEVPRMPEADDDPQHAFDAAAGAALLCAGSFFHSPSGKNATLWSGQEAAMALSWANGAHSVPLKYQAGAYYRRDDPAYLRVYGRRLSATDTYEVPIHY